MLISVSKMMSRGISMLNIFVTKNNKNFNGVKRLLLISLFAAMFFVVVIMISKGASAAGFDLTTTGGVKNAYQGETITFNMSTASGSNATIRVNFTSTYPANWIAPSEQTIMLQTNTTRNFPIAVTVPTTATPGWYYVNLTGTSDESPASIVSYSLRINVLQTVNISCAEPTHTTKPGSGIAYTVKIWNKGTSADTDTISLTVNKTSLAWNASISPSSVALKGGESQNVIVTITPPSTAALNESVVATVTAKFDTGTTYLGACSTIDLTTTVSQKYGVILYGSDNTACTPTVSNNYTLNISNTGNGYDTYIMSATENGEWVSFGNNQQLTVGPNQTTSIPIAVTVKSGTLVGNYTVTLKGTSKYDADATATKSIFVTVNQTYNVNITSDVVFASMVPGLFSETRINTTVFNITVTNTGNGQDTIDIGTSGQYANWSSLSVSRVVLGANKTTNITLTVNVSAGTAVGDYNIGVVANPVTDANKTSTLDFLIRVAQNYGADIVCLDTSNIVNPATSMRTSYALEIWNTGNGQDTILLNITSAPQGWANLSDSRVTLSPNTRQNVTLTIEAPSGTIAGDYIVTVASTPNIGRNGTSSTKTTTTKVLPVYGIRLSATTITTTAYPGANTTFPITITNTGTGADNVSFTISKPTTWSASISLQSTAIVYGGGISADLILTIPAETQSSATAGSYTITFTGGSLGDNSKTSTITLSVYVNTQYGVEITAGPNQTTNPGNITIYPITITNKGNIQDTIDLSVLSKPSDWNVIFLNGSTPVNSVTLAAKTTSTGLSMQVNIPSTETTNGTLNISVSAKSKGDVTKISNVTAYTKVIVPAAPAAPKYGVKLHSSNPNQGTTPGNKTTYSVSISNTGDTIDTIFLTTTKPSTSWGVVLSDDSGLNISAITVPANSSKNIFVTAIPPDTAAADNFTINITATSQGDSKISALTRLNISIYPVRNTLVKITSGRTSAKLDPNIEKSIDYSIVFSNEGNIMENITFVVTVPTGWSLLIDGDEKATASFGLAPNRETTSTLRLIIPKSAVSGENKIYVDADLKDGYRIGETITVTIAKPTLAIYASEITFSSSSPAEGESILIGAIVRNTGSADATDVQLQFYDGNMPLGSTIVNVAAGGNTQVQYPWTITKGVHNIKVKIGGEIIQDSYAQNVNTSKPITGEEKSLLFFTKSATISNIKFIAAGAGVGIILMCIIWGAAALRRRGKEKEKARLEEEKKQKREASVERWRETKRSTINVRETVPRPRPQIRLVETSAPRNLEIDRRGTIERKEAKPAYVKCPKCGELKEIKTTLRPIQVTCSRCGTKIGVTK